MGAFEVIYQACLRAADVRAWFRAEFAAPAVFVEW